MGTYFKKNLTLLVVIMIVGFAFSTLPFGADVALANSDVASAGDIPGEPPPETLECWTGLGIDIQGCVVFAAYYAFFVPASWVLTVAGAIFDSMLAFSLSGDVLDQPFVTDAWKAVRDVVNLSFIFVLLYIAISTILSLGDHKKLLVNLVIVGLLINFSAFATKIVIDASNIFALEFYNAISAPATNRVSGIGVNGRSISAIFITGFDPQQMTGSEVFSNWVEKDKKIIALMFVYLAAGLVTYFAAFALLKAGVLFLSRTITFWLLIISSPLAFLAFVLPGMKSKVFNPWMKSLIDTALVAPVFLFFMFIIAKIIQSDFLKTIFRPSNDGFFDIIVSTIIVFSVLYFFLMKAVDVTTKLSGEAGQAAMGALGKVTKLTPAGALAGAARGAALRTGGRALSGLAGSQAAKNFAARNPRIGGAAIGTLDAAGGKAYEDYKKKAVEKRAGLANRVGIQGTGETKSTANQRRSQFLSRPTSTTRKITGAITGSKAINQATRDQVAKEIKEKRKEAQKKRDKEKKEEAKEKVNKPEKKEGADEESLTGAVSSFNQAQKEKTKPSGE